jgi:hypothetical protein
MTLANRRGHAALAGPLQSIVLFALLTSVARVIPIRCCGLVVALLGPPVAAPAAYLIVATWPLAWPGLPETGQ